MAGEDPHSGFAAAYGRFIVAWRWPALLLSVVVFAITTFGVTRGIVISDNYRIFFDENNPQLAALDAFEDTYVREEGILFIVAPEDGDIFSRETLTAIEDLTERSWQIPMVQRVDSITNFQHTYADGDDIVVEDLVENAAELSDEALARAKGIALNEPLILGRSLSPEAHVTTVYASMELPGLKGGERAEPLAVGRRIADEMRAAYPFLEIHLNGSTPMNMAFSEHAAEDMARLVPLMYLVILVLIPLFLRSTASSVAAATTIVMSVGTAVGMVGWTGLKFTAMGAAMPHMVMTLAVADCIHILVVLLAQMRAGHTKHDAIAESVRVGFGPVFLTSLTTGIGLFSLNFSPVPPMRDFGNMVAMGVFAAFFYSVVYMPALMAVLPLRVKATPGASELPHSRLGDWVVAKRTPLLVVAVVCVVGLGFFVQRNEFKNNWTKWFSDSTEIRQSILFMREHLSGSNTVEFSVGADGASGIADPEYLEKLEAFANFLRAQPAVDHVTSIVDIMKRLNMNMHGDDPAQYRIPQDRQLAAQYLLLYEMSLPYGLDLNTQINVDKSASRVTIVTDDLESTALNSLRRDCEQWLRDHTPPYMHAEATSNSVMFASIAENTIRSLVISVPAALLAVSIALVFAFRSLRFGLISAIPNLMPLIMAYGVWGLAVGRINFGLAGVAGLAIGIVVDDTVHFMSKYLRGRREHGYSPEDSVRYAFDSVGRAMVVTSAVLIAGFSVLTLSLFRFNSNMGLLAAITIAFALVFDLFFLPAVLLALDRNKKPESAGDQATS